MQHRIGVQAEVRLVRLGIHRCLDRRSVRRIATLAKKLLVQRFLATPTRRHQRTLRPPRSPHGSGDASASYNQVSLGGDYNLSKRTDLYLIGAYQKASGHQRDASTGAIVDAGASVGSYGYGAGSTSQEIVSLGIRHKF